MCYIIITKDKGDINMNNNIAKIKIEFNHTLEEYMSIYESDYEMGDLWDFPIEDIFDNAIECDDITFWFINGRLYETTMGV